MVQKLGDHSRPKIWKFKFFTYFSISPTGCLTLIGQLKLTNYKKMARNKGSMWFRGPCLTYLKSFQVCCPNNTECCNEGCCKVKGFAKLILKPSSTETQKSRPSFKPRHELPICPYEENLANIVDVGLRNGMVPGITCREVKPKWRTWKKQSKLLICLPVE